MLESTAVEDAFTSTFIDLRALRWLEVDTLDVWHHNRAVELAVGSLCDALANPSEHDVLLIAVQAYNVVAELRDRLDEVDSGDRRTRDKLDLARQSVAALLDAIEPLLR